MIKRNYTMTEKHLNNAKQKLFDVEFNVQNSTLKVPLTKLEDAEDNLKNSYSKINFSQDKNVCFECDETEYDSDCSLGSMNSFYLDLQNDSKFLTTNKTKNNDLSSKDMPTRKNILIRTQNSDKRISHHNDNKDKKLTNKLNTTCFYGKKESITQNVHPWSYFTLQLKKMYTKRKIIRSKSPRSKFKRNIKKLRISLKTRKRKQQLIIQKMLSKKKNIKKSNILIRNRLRVPVPLLQLPSKDYKKKNQNNEQYIMPSTIENVQLNKADFITGNETIIKKDNYSLYYKNTEKQLSEFNICLENDFMDTDDFGNTNIIDNIIEHLSEEETTIQWNINEHTVF